MFLYGSYSILEKTIRKLYYDCIRELKHINECPCIRNRVQAQTVMIELGKYLGFLCVFRDSKDERLHNEAMKVIKDTKEMRTDILKKINNFLDNPIDN